MAEVFASPTMLGKRSHLATCEPSEAAPFSSSGCKRRRPFDAMPSPGSDSMRVAPSKYQACWLDRGAYMWKAYPGPHHVPSARGRRVRRIHRRILHAGYSRCPPSLALRLTGDSTGFDGFNQPFGQQNWAVRSPAQAGFVFGGAHGQPPHQHLAPAPVQQQQQMVGGGGEGVLGKRQFMGTVAIPRGGHESHEAEDDGESAAAAEVRKLK